MKNAFILRDYNIAKKIVVCKICDKHSKVKNDKLMDFICCETEKWTLESEYNSCKRDAEKNRNLVFKLTKFEYLHAVTGNCFYCKAEPRLMANGKFRNGIDRYNNDLGYLPGNVITACTMCNMVKHKSEYKHLIEHLNKMVIVAKEFKEMEDEESLVYLMESGSSSLDLIRIVLLHFTKKLDLKSKKDYVKNYLETIQTRNELYKFSCDLADLYNSPRPSNKGQDDSEMRKRIFDTIYDYVDRFDKGLIQIVDYEKIRNMGVLRADKNLF